MERIRTDRGEVSRPDRRHRIRDRRHHGRDADGRPATRGGAIRGREPVRPLSHARGNGAGTGARVTGVRARRPEVARHWRDPALRARPASRIRRLRRRVAVRARRPGRG
jgi:hypothetical protein